MLLDAAEMDVEFVEVLEEGSEGGAFGHLGEGVDILGEAFTTIAKLAIGTRNVGMGVVDIAGEEDAGVDLTPVGSHLLAVFTACVEIGHLIGSENVVHILGQLGLQR